MKLITAIQHNIVYLLMALTIIVTSTISIYSAYEAYHDEHAEGLLSLSNLVEENEKALKYRLSSYEQALLSGAGFFKGSTTVTSKEWHAYVEALNIRKYFPGINGIGFIKEVAEKDLQNYIEMQQKTNSAGFRIHPLVHKKPFYIIQYIEPLQANHQARGLNIAFEKNRFEAALLAKQSKESAMTKRVFLVQDKTKSPGFLLLHPIYLSENNFHGWVYAPFIAQKFLDNLTQSQGKSFQLQIFDGLKPSKDNLIYSSGINHPNPKFTITRPLTLMQQKWLLVWSSSANFEKSVLTWQPWLIGCLGLLFTLGLTIFFKRIAAHSSSIEKAVEKKTKELFASAQQLRLLIQNTPAAVAMFDNEMHYILTSSRWMTDYKLDDDTIIGKSHYDVFPEIRNMPHWLSLHKRALSGESIDMEEDSFIRPDGRREWIKWAIHPWKTANDTIGGVVMFTEIITERKEIELRTQVLRRISTEVSEASDVKEAIDKSIQIICMHLKWPLGHAYIWDKNRSRMRSLKTWYCKDIELYKPFQQLSEDISFSPGEGLPGRVYEQGKTIFIQDVSKDSNFPRNKVFTNLPLRSGIGIPILVKNEVMIVMEFFDKRKIPDGEGMVEFYEMLSTPISRLIEKKQIEKALEESDNLKKAVLDSAMHLIIATDQDGTVLIFNQSAENALGYKASEVVGIHTPALWHDLSEIKEKTRALNQAFGVHLEPGFETFVYKSRYEGVDSGEWTLIRKDGSRFPVILNVTTLRNSENQITGYLGILEDITHKKIQEQQLKSSEETFRSAMQFASVGMALVDMNGRWVKVNPALTDLLGYSEEEMKQINFQSIGDPDDLALDSRLKNDLLNGEKQSYQVEQRFLHKSGYTIWTLLSVSLVRNPDDSPKHFIKQIFDISERKKMEDMKNEFISTVSHELRTPLTAIQASLSLIEEKIQDEFSPKALRLIHIAKKNGQRLIMLINDILDIDKIASGKMHFELRKHNLVDLVKQSIESNQAYADKYRIRIRFKSSQKNVPVELDAGLLNQIMANLISNAVKFSTENEAIVISIDLRGNMVRTSVHDKGKGIPESFKKCIFQKFSQADASITRKKGGTGLGLYICKQLIEAMQGTIDFQSEEGKGCTFWFDLPLDPRDYSDNPISETPK